MGIKLSRHFLYPEFHISLTASVTSLQNSGPTKDFPTLEYFKYIPGNVGIYRTRSPTIAGVKEGDLVISGSKDQPPDCARVGTGRGVEMTLRFRLAVSAPGPSTLRHASRWRRYYP